MTETPETIYLIPGEDIDGSPAMVWCDDPAPDEHCDPEEAVKYVRADVHQAIIDRQAKAALSGMDAAKKHALSAEKNAKRLLAESSPEALESERSMNAALTEENEQLRDRVAELEALTVDLHRDLKLRAEPDFDGTGQMVVNCSAWIWERLCDEAERAENAN